jgi:hypothetical protein
MSSLDNIPEALSKKTVLKTRFDTSDIREAMYLMKERFRKYNQEFCKWANAEFEATPESLKKLWKMVKYSIKYKTDPRGSQYVKSPLALVQLGNGDCKSKTVFVNMVLECLGIPYTTRFTYYNPQKPEEKHVYSIAHLPNQDIIIDTVYHFFNREKRYYRKEDYDMSGELALIEGIGNKTGSGAYANNSQLVPQNTNCGVDARTAAYLEGKARMLAVKEEIRQKKAYVPQFQDIPFHKLTEGQATLELLERELRIIQVMQPQLDQECEKGLNMIYQAKEKGVYQCSGMISPFLERYAYEIHQASKKTRPANSYGLVSKFVQQNKAGQKHPCAPSVGNINNNHCLDFLWSELAPNTTDYFRTPSPNGACQMRPVYDLLNSASMSDSFPFKSLYPRATTTNTANDPTLLYSTPDKQGYKNSLYYSYGASTPYKVRFDQYGASVWQQIQQGITSGRITVNGPNAGSYYGFQSQADFNAFVAELNENSGVQSNWVNNTFRTDPNQDATVGSGLYYQFADSITEGNSFVNTNELPASVLTKRGFQSQFLNSCVAFSGVSTANINQLTRLGVLFDSGGYQPEALLSAGYRQYRGVGSSVGLDPATITAIVVAIIGALASGAATVAKAVIEAQQEAEQVDISLARAANMQPPPASQMPLQQDWNPTNTSAGNQDEKEGSLLPLFGAAAAGLAVYSISQ